MKIGIRKVKDALFRLCVVTLVMITFIPLILIFFYVISQGITAINWDLFTKLPRPVGETGGGVSNAIAGTIILIVLASVISVPLGILGGIYLYEKRKYIRLAELTGLAVDVLQGIPSIVIGIVTYLWVVKPMGRFSGFSGGLALGIMMLPMVVKSTEETLKLIPESLKEASLSLGVPYYRTMLKVVLPSGLSGIITGVMVGIARIAGETAPLLFTAFGTPFMNVNIFKPVNALPLVIFNYATSPYQDWQKIAWGSSLVLIGVVFVFNTMAKMWSGKWKIRF